MKVGKFCKISCIHQQYFQNEQRTNELKVMA